MLWSRVQNPMHHINRLRSLRPTRNLFMFENLFARIMGSRPFLQLGIEAPAPGGDLIPFNPVELSSDQSDQAQEGGARPNNSVQE